jgi:hypothetical protein
MKRHWDIDAIEGDPATQNARSLFALPISLGPDLAPDAVLAVDCSEPLTMLTSDDLQRLAESFQAMIQERLVLLWSLFN